jgi:hypothetical protein
VTAAGKLQNSSRFPVAVMLRSPRLNIGALPYSTSCQVCNRIREIPMRLNDTVHSLARDAKELRDFSDANEVTVTHR